jgi:hypothetical protein
VEVDLAGVGLGEPGEVDERPNMMAMATLSRTVIEGNGRGIW